MQKTPSNTSIQTQIHTQHGGDEIRITDEDEITALLGVLEDRDSRKILEAIDDHPLCAQELSACCDLPSSTAYRKLNELSQVGILKEEVEIARDGRHTRIYHQRFDSISITLSDTGFEVTLSPPTE